MLVLFAAFIISAYPQVAGTNSGSEPCPSNLRVLIKNNLIIMSWIDSPYAKKGYIVFRSEARLSAATLHDAVRVGSIAQGVQSYTDIPPDDKPYFYGVFAAAEDGSPYQVFLPAQNITSAGLALPRSPENSGAAADTLTEKTGKGQRPQATSTLPFVSLISAKANGDAIVITYKASPKSRLVLYRGTSPILKTADLLNATLVAAFVDTTDNFSDFPVPGVDYYYAILGEEDLKAGNIVISADVNSLSTPVHLRSSAVSSSFAETPQFSRITPLPYFLMEGEVSGGDISSSQDEYPPPEMPISPETAKAISLLLSSTPTVLPSMPEMRILSEEQAAPVGGEDYALSLIVSDRMAAKDWTEAADQLRKYLSLNRSPKATARARFYLGEALALSGSNRDAFFEFLSARDFYPTETKPWIDYVLYTLNKRVMD
jgi:hypothetical protein